VSDTGVGIPEDKIKMLGIPFFSSKNEGTGLGLTQVYTTIHEHGGNISVESMVGKGTTIHIQLPINSSSSNESNIKNLNDYTLYSE
jgi:two-component system, sporulation sensor kinase A